MATTQCQQGNGDQYHSMVSGPRVQLIAHEDRVSLFSSKLVVRRCIYLVVAIHYDSNATIFSAELIDPTES
jgi:hypothetical protein